MSITIKNQTIPSILTSSFAGHDGDGMFPLSLLPSYRKLMKIILETGSGNITKSATRWPHIGNFRLLKPWTWRCIQNIGNRGMLNAYGLTNPGVEAIAPKIARAIAKGFKVIPSFYPQFIHGQAKAIEETGQAIEIYHHYMEFSFWVLELNFSCPNSAEKIKENMADAVALIKDIKQKYPWLCLIAKISFVHPQSFAQELVSAGVDIIHAINTIPHDLVYPDARSPLADLGGGGVSGGPIFRQAYEYNKRLRETLPQSVPMIMGGGVSDVSDAEKYYCIDAKAVSICTVCRLIPKEAERIVMANWN